MPSFVLTYGVNMEWQRMKVRGGGYRGYIEALPHSRKGPVIADMKNHNTNTFDFVAFDDNLVPLACYAVHRMITVDDKVLSLQNSDSQNVVVLMERPEDRKPGAEKAAFNGHRIKSMDQMANNGADQLQLFRPNADPVLSARITSFIPLKSLLAASQ